jgi:hypothetical protein
VSRTDTTYLLHLSRPLGNTASATGYAQHYTGSAKGGRAGLARRLAEHGTCDGARMLLAARRQGITWELARTWPGGRDRERQLKRQGGAARRCPLCGVTPRAAHAPEGCPKPCAICAGPWPTEAASGAELAMWPEPPY